MKRSAIFLTVVFMFSFFNFAYAIDQACADQKVALVTGASRGIGRALAEELLKDNWTVFGTGRSIEDLEDLKRGNSHFIPVKADFTSNFDIKAVAKAIKDSGLKLGMMVHNAGMKSPPCPLSQYNVEQIDEVMSVNLLSPMKLFALLTNEMLPGSRILFVTSRAATLQLKEGSTYCASKAGLNQLAEILRKELAEQKIAVQAVIPGEVDTYLQKVIRDTKTFHLNKEFNEAFEDGKLISPETCALFLKWLLCEMSFDQYATGQLPISIYDEWHHPFWLKDKKDLPPFPF